MARPTLYTEELAASILEQISDGTPLTDICSAEGMPDRRTVTNWKRDQPDFAERYEAARLDGADAIAQRARNTARGKTEDLGGDSKGDVQRDKLIIDTDLKLLAKWFPQRYGDKVTLSGDPDNPLHGVSDDQIDKRLAELMAKAQQGRDAAAE